MSSVFTFDAKETARWVQEHKERRRLRRAQTESRRALTDAADSRRLGSRSSQSSPGLASEAPVDETKFNDAGAQQPTNDAASLAASLAKAEGLLSALRRLLDERSREWKEREGVLEAELASAAHREAALLRLVSDHGLSLDGPSTETPEERPPQNVVGLQEAVSDQNAPVKPRDGTTKANGALKKQVSFALHNDRGESEIAAPRVASAPSPSRNSDQIDNSSTKKLTREEVPRRESEQQVHLETASERSAREKKTMDIESRLERKRRRRERRERKAARAAERAAKKREQR
jgi:hypothetical protein